MKQIPGIACLRAYVLVAQSGSYSKAARTLGVSHAAVIQNVQALERSVHTKLIIKRGKVLALSSKGLELFNRIGESVRTLEEIFEPRQADVASRVVIATSPAVANAWLVQKIEELRKSFPSVDFNIDCTPGGTGEEDIWIREDSFGAMNGEVLLREALVPVASSSSPDAMQVRRPLDLSMLRLIENPLHPWKTWFAAVGLQISKLKIAMTTSDSFTARLAAERGVGVALCPRFAVTSRVVALLPNASALETVWYVGRRITAGRNSRLIDEVYHSLTRTAPAAHASQRVVAHFPGSALKRAMS